MRILSALLMSALLVLAACGGGDSATPTSAPTTAPAAATEAPTAEPTVAETEEITETTDMTGTEEVTDTEEMTDTEDMTDTEEMTSTEELSGMVDMTDTTGVSGSMAVTDTEAMTGTEEMTDTEGMTETGEATGITAVATLQDTEGNEVGQATFTEADGGVAIQVELQGLTVADPGEHGIHIHTVGACTPDFEAAGPHFNPTGAQHGMDNPGGPHSGDLPNIEIDEDGNATFEATTDLVTLGEGENSVFDADGSAIMVHAGPDDMITDPSGNSGDRIACGVIEQE